MQQPADGGTEAEAVRKRSRRYQRELRNPAAGSRRQVGWRCRGGEWPASEAAAVAWELPKGEVAQQEVRGRTQAESASAGRRSPPVQAGGVRQCRQAESASAGRRSPPVQAGGVRQCRQAESASAPRRSPPVHPGGVRQCTQAESASAPRRSPPVHPGGVRQCTQAESASAWTKIRVPYQGHQVDAEHSPKPESTNQTSPVMLCHCHRHVPKARLKDRGRESPVWPQEACSQRQTP
ncbi:hypothetical protein P7K49_019712 [Saguinus oedipus]|uniref:Uncharacterized protein n=1 Tax=Saguinus oedipus TaxID=9490 RepID=A0ABQ9UZ69_SAGOE|nr:hypothetical protein P7K49_019712 [Saguinus oedipus]